MKLAHWPKFQKLHIYTFALLQGVDIDLNFALRVPASKIRANFQNFHIWAWNLAIGQCSRSCTYTLALFQGVKNWVYFHSMGSGFWDMGQFSKFPIWVRNLAIGKSSSSGTYNILLPQGVVSWFLLYRYQLQDTSDMGWFSKLSYLGMKLGNWLKCQMLHIYSRSTPGIKIELIFALQGAVSEIRVSFQNCHIWA